MQVQYQIKILSDWNSNHFSSFIKVSYKLLQMILWSWNLMNSLQKWAKNKSVLKGRVASSFMVPENVEEVGRISSAPLCSWKI